MYNYKFKVTSIYDGDTVTGIVDLGFKVTMELKVRLANIDTPEIRTRDLAEKKRGYEAKAYLQSLVDEYGDRILIKTTKKGKYGRWIGELLITDLFDNVDDRFYNTFDNDPKSINDALVKAELAIYKEY